MSTDATNESAIGDAKSKDRAGDVYLCLTILVALLGFGFIVTVGVHNREWLSFIGLFIMLFAYFSTLGLNQRTKNLDSQSRILDRESNWAEIEKNVPGEIVDHSSESPSNGAFVWVHILKNKEIRLHYVRIDSDTREIEIYPVTSGADSQKPEFSL